MLHLRDAGESLLEVLMAVAILGIASTAVLGGMVTSVLGSDIHRKQSEATAVLTSAAEVLKSRGTTWIACADTTAATSDPRSAEPYRTAVAAVDRPTGWGAPSITGIEHWDGTSFQATCYDTVAYERLLRLQRVTIQVTSPDGRGNETLSLVKRDG